ncbi:MAG: hypothetical protein WCO82_04290 [Sphingomonadales bacterium]|jgi:hypothetical protein
MQKTDEPLAIMVALPSQNWRAVLFENLRDLGLESCGTCGVWKHRSHFADLPDPVQHPLSRALCSSCLGGAA